ncbi:MAG: HEAT repeat domain-containing protein, partial [Polyangiaceae bacterium]
PLPVITADGPDADVEARELFDELGWDAAQEDDARPPPSAAIAVPPHRPPLRHTDGPSEPSVVVNIEDELAAIVDRLAAGEADEQAEGELLRQGERAMRVLMDRFPGPIVFERSRIAVTTPPPRASECGPVLRLVARERKVALPFVLEKLQSPDTETRGWATHVLGELPYAEAIAPLLLRLRDVDLGTRVSASFALVSVARIYPEEVRGAVLGLSRSSDPIDRSAAMRVMGELREPSLVPELVHALADGDEAAVASAHASLHAVTRQDFGLDARPWLRWWEANASRHRIEWLIDALSHDVGEIRKAAGEELRAITKEYFGYAADLPPRDRERSQQRYRDWWVTEGRARFRRNPP